MARSKHTDPRHIRAYRRIHAPFESRSAGDLRIRRKLGQMLLVPKGTAGLGRAGSHSIRPRIILRKPKPGFHHPAGKREINRFLDSIGPIALYGLRSVELARVPVMTGRGALVFGQYEAPGRILLFEQAELPWRLPGILRHADTNRFKGFGVTITIQPAPQITTVERPKDSLKRFMLEGVLLHELGHHVLQQYKGKRPVGTARTRDHEAAAVRFASRQRALLSAAAMIMTNPSTEPELVVQRQLDAYNARDLDALLTIYAENAEMFEHPSKLLASGSAQLRQRLRVLINEPDLHALLRRRIGMGNIVVDHEEVTRNFPEGKGSLELIMIYEVQSGRIVRAWSIAGAKSLGPNL